MQQAPAAERLHVALFGRRNAGKSSLINALTGQPVALVSPVPGTTTDPVFKAMELHPVGPVVFVDTAGIDDVGELGDLRAQRTRDVIRRADLALLVVAADGPEPGGMEEELLAELKKSNVPVLGILNKVDLAGGADGAADDAGAGALAERTNWFRKRGIEPVLTAAGAQADSQPAAPAGVAAPTSEGAGPDTGIEDLREAIARAAAPILADEANKGLLDGVVSPGQTVVLIVPIDSGAPRGRLILAQVQAIRAVLDGRAVCVVTTEKDLPLALGALKGDPDLVVTDSQAFAAVAAAVPERVPMTSFSILFARYKGDLVLFAAGLKRVKELKAGDRVLIAEACTHRTQHDDIGRSKIPRLLERYVGGNMQFAWAQGGEFPRDLGAYRLVVHCGGCMLTRKIVLGRLRAVGEAGVPVVNYGVLLAFLNGVGERALAPFRDAAGSATFGATATDVAHPRAHIA